MFCPECGNSNPDHLRFCTGCGINLTAIRDAENASVAATVNSTEPRQGQIIDNKYRLESQLGEGGMGAVWRATRLNIGDAVAIKVLHSGLLNTPNGAERFRREAQSAARLKHPNVVTIHDFGVSHGLLYLVMELVEGQSLRAFIQKQGPLRSSVIAEIMSQVCSALDEAHSRGIIHRDIKPDNIMVSEASGRHRVKVLDFGIAKMLDTSTGSSSGTLTQTGSVIGTPHYMSPEQCLGEDLDGRSDLYSLGVVLYEMLTGRLPFNSPTMRSVIAAHLSQQPVPVSSLNNSITPQVEAVVMRTLSKEKSERQQSAAQLSQELISALNKTVRDTPRPTTPESQSDDSTVDLHYSQNPPKFTGFPPLASAAPAQHAPPTRSNTIQQAAPQFSPQTIQQVPIPAQPLHEMEPRRRSIAPWLITALLALLAIGSAAGWYWLRPSPKAATLAEIQHGNLVKPEGSSAFDLFEKGRDKLSRDEVLQITALVTQRLEKRGEDIIGSLKNDPSEIDSEWTEATRIYTWLNELKPGAKYEARKVFAQARVDFLRKDFDKAMTGYKRASELDPKWAAPYNGIGRAYLNLKDKVRARDYYLRATAADAEWLYPWINLAQLSLDLEDYPAAEKYARRALELNADKASIHYLLGRALEKTDSCAALPEYQTAIDKAYSTTNPGFNVDNLKKKVAQLTTSCQSSAPLIDPNAPPAPAQPPPADSPIKQ
jgi:serine/threonine-protein kinase